MGSFILLDDDTIINLDQVNSIKKFSSREQKRTTINGVTFFKDDDPWVDTFGIEVHFNHGGTLDISSDDVEYMNAVFTTVINNVGEY